MNIPEIILSAAGAVLGLLATALTFLVKFLKSAKAKKAAELTLSIANAVVPYIEEAEQLAHYGGAGKKEYVMNRVREYTKSIGTEFDAAAVSDKIDELVALTKRVNVAPHASAKEDMTGTPGNIQTIKKETKTMTDRFVDNKTQLNAATLNKFEADMLDAADKSALGASLSISGRTLRLNNPTDTVISSVTLPDTDIPAATQSTRGGIKIWISGSTLNISTN